MQQPHDLVALVTLLSLAVYAWMIFVVGKARETRGVPAPVVSGDEVFERHYRVQMNTLEGLPVYLPCLWLFSLYWNNLVAAGLGLVWVVGRIVYALAYVKDPKTRSLGFGLQGVATLALMIGAIVGAARALIVVGI